MQGRRSLEISASPRRRFGEPRGYWISRRRGLTLVELMVVIAILVLLVGILMPVVEAIRRSAINTVCTARLHELTHACNLYRNDFGRYPRLSPYAASPPASSPSTLPTIDLTPLLQMNLSDLGLLRVPGLFTPEDIHTDLINSLAGYLRYPTVAGGSPAEDLPPSVQCPTVEDDDAQRESLVPILSSGPSPETTTYYTGYVYVGRLGEGFAGAASMRLLRPDRPAMPANPAQRAVLWADDMHWTSLAGGVWRFAHPRPAAQASPVMPLSYTTPGEFYGQHRAYTDGSVEWIDSCGFDLQDGRGPPNGGEGPTLEISSTFRWWF